MNPVKWIRPDFQNLSSAKFVACYFFSNSNMYRRCRTGRTFQVQRNLTLTAMFLFTLSMMTRVSVSFDDHGDHDDDDGDDFF